MYGIGCL